MPLRLTVIENHQFANEERQSFDVEGAEEVALRRLLARILRGRARKAAQREQPTAEAR